MLSAIEIPGFLNQLCLKKKKKKETNQLDFWYDDIDSRNK